jgi:class 3 adenylate cyclase/SAM-dependent methyltransferase
VTQTTLERRFAELLGVLGLEIPKGATRPVARNQRLSEEIVDAFLSDSGGKLLELLCGIEGTRSWQEIPLHHLETIVSLFYGTINDAYVGIDSHPPKRFLQVHPFLLTNLATSETRNTLRTDRQSHVECHFPRRVRIIPFTEALLQDHLDEFPSAQHYFELHKEHKVDLLCVDPDDFDAAHDNVLSAEWTTDLGLWTNTCALLFEPKIREGNDKLRLELLYPHESRFEKYRRYVGELLKKAKRATLKNGKVQVRPMEADYRDHLRWSLESMFQPGLADLWDEFVAPKRRVSRLGPFVEKQISAAGKAKATILDAATGVGCDSVYLLSKGHKVVSNEIDPRLIAHATELNDRNGNPPLDIKRFDWRHFEHLADSDSFDVVLALGNSLSCLPSEGDVRTVLTRFAHLLKADGLLIVDERDYPTMFAERARMTGSDFLFPGEVVYCSRSIRARPLHIPDKAGVDNELLTLEYIRASDDQAVGTFDVLPFADGQLAGLLEDSGFRNIKTFYNLKPRRGKTPSQFVTYVASRGYDTSQWRPTGGAREQVIAFTDITQSTIEKKRLGETRYAREWAAHQRRVKALLTRHSGKLINDTGDGFLMSFRTPTKAIDCLSAIVNEPGSNELSVRAGVLKGRAVTDAEGKLRGKDVDIASRICDCELARPNHVVADDHVGLKVTNRSWRRENGIELRGVGRRDLWVLEG